MRAFFLAPESPRPLAVVRILTGLAFLSDAVLHWPYAVELYSTAGSPMPLFAGMGLVPPAISALTAVLFSTLLGVSLFCVMVGWQTRLNLLIACGLSIWLGLLDAPGTFSKYSVIGIHLLLLLSFSRCGAVWSVDRHFQDCSRVPLSPAWPRRLIQLLLCGIYWGAAITKIRVPDFASGDLLLFSMLDQRWGGGWLAQWLTLHRSLLVLVSLGTVFFEVLFPVLIWIPRLRPWMLLAGVLFHLSLELFLTIGIFGLTMIAVLCSFLEESDLRGIAHQGRKLLRFPAGFVSGVSESSWETQPQRSWVSSALWLAFVLITVGGGVGWQYRADWYHVFHRPPMENFRTLSADEVEPILAEQPLSARAHFHQVEIGSRYSGGQVFGEREQFHPGMMLNLFARLSVPHPELQIRVIMTSPDEGEFIHETVLESQPTHLMIPFRLRPEFPEGGYHLELQAALPGSEEWESVKEFRFQLLH